jgi:hypothetical protein
MCVAFAKTLDDDVVHAPVRRRAPDQQRLEPARESDATLVEQCPSCGLTVTGSYHRDGAACISALRDVLAELQLRSGASSARTPKHTAAGPTEAPLVQLSLIRYRSRARHATRQAPTAGTHRQAQRLKPPPPKTERCGNAGPWTAVENRHRSGSGRFARFPTAAHRPWKTLRVFHIPTAPTILLFSSQTTQKGPQTDPTLTIDLQAHPSMRKCSCHRS